jgi:hypothetical protein
VTCPPGGATRVTSPMATGSGPATTTMGRGRVACMAARGPAGDAAPQTSTASWTRATARARGRASVPSAPRHSMTRVGPSTAPRARRPWAQASVRQGESRRGRSTSIPGPCKEMDSSALLVKLA